MISQGPYRYGICELGYLKIPSDLPDLVNKENNIDQFNSCFCSYPSWDLDESQYWEVNYPSMAFVN